ncbi:unnamed protein product [Mesocestoides corti]|uniref:Uncharacterized protein n=1 Tax=Mesocestoides corti TaxID=53468 RepID=A0A0R3U629_MESCO|nr:unnamed protein product [Mesocestoides corti]
MISVDSSSHFSQSIALAYLAKTLAAEDSFEYAAIFTLGKARCEANVHNYPGEASALMEAGRLFLKAEENLQITKTHGYEIELFLDDLHRIEVFRVLLVLTVLPPKSEELVGDGQLSLLAYTDDAKESAKTSVIDYMDRDLVLLLRSLVMSYQLEDVNGFELTATLLQPYVDYAQRKVLCDILTNLIHPPDDTL